MKAPAGTADARGLRAWCTQCDGKTSPSTSFEQGVELFAQRPGPWQQHGIAAGGTLHAQVLEHAGFDPRQVSGFAFGIGVERLAMLKFDIKDIRELWQPPYVPH